MLLHTLLAPAACITDPAALLAANRAATVVAGTPAGTTSATYSYAGQGLAGTVRTTVDRATGRYVEDQALGIVTGASGWDGERAWLRDLSGFHSRQDGGNVVALAIAQAYRNAERWWRGDRSGARIESAGCNALRVTPPGGTPFEAWFDAETYRLSRIRQTETFATIVETRYADYARRGDRMMATRIDTISNDDEGSAETLRLTSHETSAARPARAYAMPSAQPADWSLPREGRATVPFRLLNNHVIVDVSINGKAPLPFLVDTGGHNILTPSALATLGLTAQGDSPSGGAGEKTVSNGYVRVARADAGGAVLTDKTFVTLDFSPPAVEGLTLGGMLGVEFLERFAVRFDYGAGTLTFIDSRRLTEAERAAAGVAVPFTTYEHMPQIAGSFDGRPARFNIDTGSRLEVTMTAPFVASAGLRAGYSTGVTVTDGWGVGGPSRSYVVRAQSLTLGKVNIERPVAGLSTATRGAYSDANYDGNVGSGLLKRFVATFDYAGRTLYLEPVANPDADVGRFDRSGMWLNLGPGGLEIMDIAAGGPAAAAGLRVGDVITAIGGVAADGRTLSDTRRALKIAAVGTPIAIAYRRSGTAAATSLIPRDLIPD